jgi:hypothetical protein
MTGIFFNPEIVSDMINKTKDRAKKARSSEFTASTLDLSRVLGTGEDDKDNNFLIDLCLESVIDHSDGNKDQYDWKPRDVGSDKSQFN